MAYQYQLTHLPPQERAKNIVSWLSTFRTPPDLDLFAKSLGVTNIYSSREVDEGAVYRSRRGFVVMLNPDKDHRRQRFSLAHELAHILLDPELIVAGHNEPQFWWCSDPANETRCNDVAGHLLMPTRPFKRALSMSGASYAGLLSLSREFQASGEAVISRVVNLIEMPLVVLRSIVSRGTRRLAISRVRVARPEGTRVGFIPLNKHVDDVEQIRGAFESLGDKLIRGIQSYELGGFDGEFLSESKAHDFGSDRWVLTVVHVNKPALGVA